MSRKTRSPLFALLLLVCGLAATPAFAQPPVGPLPSTALTARLSMIRIVTVMGAGSTAAEALDNALDVLREDYHILRSTELDSGCPEVSLPPLDDEGLPGLPDTEVVCWSHVRALVLVKGAVTSS